MRTVADCWLYFAKVLKTVAMARWGTITLATKHQSICCIVGNASKMMDLISTVGNNTVFKAVPAVGHS